jgi:hypothetical protein
LNRFLLISFALLIILISGSGCDGGLSPADADSNPVGVITGVVTYSGSWPPADSLKDLRFVPLQSEPQTAQDIFADIETLVFSERLNYFVDRDTFTVLDVQNGVYSYNAVAQRYGDELFADWRPVGIYEENSGVITVSGDTVHISVHVDFDNIPPFPAEGRP